MSHEAPVRDDKDWTWVLDRRCEECGSDVGSVSGEELVTRFRAVLPRWSGVLVAPGATSRPAPRTWSPVEYGSHVQDVFRLLVDRVELMRHVDHPTFADWDQDAAAVDGDYASADPVDVSEGLDAAGRAAADLYAGLTASALERTGRRSDGAELTVLSLGRYFLHDVEHHLHDVNG